MDQLNHTFENLHSQYFSMVLHLCRGFMKGDRDLAHDLAQDVFINVWNALPGYRAEASYKTWIYRITVNTCLLQIRKDKNKIKVPLETVATLLKPIRPRMHKKTKIFYIVLSANLTK